MAYLKENYNFCKGPRGGGGPIFSEGGVAFNC